MIPRSPIDILGHPEAFWNQAHCKQFLASAGLAGSFVTRYAPSPTGFLHLGHIVNALIVWGMARAHGGTVILRMEDHDRQRCRPEYERAIIEDLRRLNFFPDLGTFAEFEAGRTPFRQSDREELYLDALETLRGAGRVYACDCSRKEIARRAREARREPAAGEELPYDGYCRNRGIAFGPDKGIRVELEEQEIRFTDGLLGEQIQRDCSGDLLVKDRRGNWTYQFAVTLDDLEQGVNLVIRGQDLLTSTGRQILLGRLLGRKSPPAFLHHPLICNESGAKLSKSDGATGVRELLAAGESPQSVLARAAANFR